MPHRVESSTQLLSYFVDMSYREVTTTAIFHSYGRGLHWYAVGKVYRSYCSYRRSKHNLTWIAHQFSNICQLPTTLILDSLLTWHICLFLKIWMRETVYLFSDSMRLQYGCRRTGSGSLDRRKIIIQQCCWKSACVS